jgi:hypothetical protein
MEEQRRRSSDHWHLLEIAVPAGAMFLLFIGFAFIWAISETAQEQSRLRREHGALMQKVVDSCRQHKP